MSENFAEKLERFRNMPEYGSLFHPPYAVRSTLGFSIKTQEAERLAILEGEKTNFPKWNFDAAQNIISKWLRQNLQNPIGTFNLDRFKEQVPNKPLWIMHKENDEIKGEIECIAECKSLIKEKRDEVKDDPSFLSWKSSYTLKRVTGEGVITESCNVPDKEKFLDTCADELEILEEAETWFNEVSKIIQKEIGERESHVKEVMQKVEVARKICAEAEKIVARMNEIIDLPEAKLRNLAGFPFKRAEEFMKARMELDSLHQEYDAACDHQLFSDFNKVEPAFPKVKGMGWSTEAETRKRIEQFYNNEISKRKK
jgi:hypothetical protein